MDYFFILLLALLSGVFVAGGLILSGLLAPRNPGSIKNMPYECGELPIGQAWVQYNVAYYLFGLLFLVFDVETVFLFPWAVAFRNLGMPGLIEMVLFLLVLVVGLVYAWRKGALEWH